MDTTKDEKRGKRRNDMLIYRPRSGLRLIRTKPVINQVLSDATEKPKDILLVCVQESSITHKESPEPTINRKTEVEEEYNAIIEKLNEISVQRKDLQQKALSIVNKLCTMSA